MAMTQETQERVSQLSAKASEVVQKAKEAKATATRKSELKEQAMEIFRDMKLEMQSSPKIEVPSQPVFTYDVPSSIESDSLASMHMKSAASYGSREHDVRQFHKFCDLAYLGHKIMYPSTGKEKSAVPLQTMQIWQQFIKGENELGKALATSTANQGQEWVPTGFSRDFFDRVEADLIVAQLHDMITIPAGVGDYDVGAAGAAVTAYKVAESTDDESDKIPALSPNTRKVTFSPEDIGARALVSVQQTEDAALNTVDFVIRQLIIAYARAIDTAIINGDTAATHQDTDVTSATDAKKLWDGYRKLANTAAKIDANDAVSNANIRQAIQAMGIYGRPGEVALVTNAVGYWKLHTSTEVLTVDKYGANAAIRTGEVGNYLGNPIIWSDLVKEDLAEDGDYDGVTTNETMIAFPNMQAFALGVKRDVTVETEKDIETQQIKIVTTGRADFQAKYASSENYVATLYDINTAT